MTRPHDTGEKGSVFMTEEGFAVDASLLVVRPHDTGETGSACTACSTPP